MFEDLTKHINKENLQKIKKKNRYLNQMTQQNDQQNHYERQRSQSKSSKHSQDSISNYQLKQRQEMFNKIINQDGFQKDNLDSSSFIQQKITWKYYTPESKIKQLQRQLELSNQHRKIYQQIKERQIVQLKQEYQRKLQAINIDLSIMKVKQSSFKRDEQIVKNLRKENTNLRQLLQKNESKCTELQLIIQTYKRDKSDKQSLLLEMEILKSIALYKKQFMNQNSNTMNINNISLNMKSKQNQQINELYKIEIRSINDANNHLKRKCQELESQIFQLKLKNQRITQNCQEELRKIKNENQKIIFQVEKLKLQKEKLQKSLMETMSQFSHHLHQMTYQSIKTSSDKFYPQSLRNSPSSKHNFQQKKYKYQEQNTINFDQDEIKKYQNQNKSSLIIDQSPITFRNEQKRLNTRKRIQSQAESTKLRNFTNSKKEGINNPQPQYNKKQRINESNELQQTNKVYINQTKIKKLQKKLEQANKKIVQLLQQKLKRRTSSSSFYC